MNLLNFGAFDAAVAVYDVDGSIGLIQPDRPLARPFAVQGLIVEAFDEANSLDPLELDQRHPVLELRHDVIWAFAQILLGLLCQFYLPNYQNPP